MKALRPLLIAFAAFACTRVVHDFRGDKVATTTSGCTPGVSQACSCASGATSSQQCNPDGTAFSTCNCARGLRVAIQPSPSNLAGQPFAQQPKVTIEDQNGAVLDDQTLSITLTLTSGTGALLGTTTVSAVAGIASFSDLAIDKVGSDKMLTATSGIFTTMSAAFAVTPGAAAKLALQQAPTAQQNIGFRVTPGPVVAVLDAYDNLTASSAVITAIVTTAGETISGQTSVPAQAGLAAFTRLFISGNASLATLAFSSPALAGSEIALAMSHPDLDWPGWQLPGNACEFCTDGTKQVACLDPSALLGQQSKEPQMAPSDDTSQGYLIDQVTGLIWQNDGDAYGYAGGNLSQAAAHCAGLTTGGFAWRLPTRIELATLLDYANLARGGGTVGFWTQTEVASDNTSVWIAFDDGGVQTNPKASSNGARCTVGAPGASPPSDPAHAPAGQYSVASETVADNRTFLKWQRNPDASTYAWPQALTHCASLTLAGETGWRVPTAKELLSIVNDRVASPAIDLNAFPMTLAGSFWTSTPAKPSCAPAQLPAACDTALAANCMVPDAWIVSFDLGDLGANAITAMHEVRCVR